MTGQERGGDELSGLYQEAILEHAKSPRKKRAPSGPCRCAEGANPLCGDRVEMFVELSGQSVQSVCFQGDGCAISQASASMLCVELEGLSREEGLELIERARRCAATGDASGLEESRLAAFSGVSAFPMRVKCATLAMHVAKKALEAVENGDAGYVEP